MLRKTPDDERGDAHPAAPFRVAINRRSSRRVGPASSRRGGPEVSVDVRDSRPARLPPRLYQGNLDTKRVDAKPAIPVVG